MGHKIFVSYKYHDSNVQKITNEPFGRDTARDYVDKLQSYFDSTDDIYKGEDDGEDLSLFDDDVIWEKLKNRIYDTTLTIVLISPGMKIEEQSERDQWIPWEISYSLKEVSRKNKSGNLVTSSSNAILAIVLPDLNGSYSYFLENRNCCSSECRTLKTNTLFTILKKNMFNAKKPDKKLCTNNAEIYYGESSYSCVVKWKDFIVSPKEYIEKAYHLQNSIEKFDIYKEIV